MNRTSTKIEKLSALILVGGVLLFSACKKDRGPIIDPVPNETLGVYVLNEGAYNTPNGSELTYFNVATNVSTQNYFQKQNPGVTLGTNANDLQQYGSKMYCVVTGIDNDASTAYVEVISIATGKSIKRIPFSDGTSSFRPRFIAFHKNKAYVSSYDGYISRIDTAGLTIEARVATGGALEGLAIVNEKLYVTNSQRFDVPDAVDNAVSVLNLGTFSKVKDIEVGVNPTRIFATATGELLVLVSGVYNAIPASVQKINSVSDTKTGDGNEIDLSYLKVIGDRGFAVGGYTNYGLNVLEPATGSVGGTFVTDATVLMSPYGVSIDALSNEVLVSDAGNFVSDGKVYAFTPEGKLKYSFATGLAPQNIVYNYLYK